MSLLNSCETVTCGCKQRTDNTSISNTISRYTFSHSRMTRNQNNTFEGLILHLLAKIVLLLLLVYYSVTVHNSLIPWSTSTTRAGWVGLLL